jgi:hypothetical protein
MKRRRRLRALAALSLFVFETPARGQEFTPFPGQPNPLMPPHPEVEQTPLGDSGVGDAPRHLSPRSVKLFDSARSLMSYELDVGPLWNRRVQETTPEMDRTNFRRGAPLAGEIGLGTVFTTPARPFYLVGHAKTLLRIIDDKSVSWALYHHELGGGLMLGPLEPEVRIRLGALTADIIHAQPSIQLLTPGASAALGLHFGNLRIEFRGNVDYLWRWFGPDYVLRSITIGLRLDMPKQNPLGQSP